MHKPRRRPTSHSSQTHGAPASSHWPDVLLVSDSSGQELTAPLQQATGNPRARDPLSLAGRRLHRPAPAPVFLTNTDGCCDHCNPPSHAHAVGAARMPHSSTQRTSHGKAISSCWTPHRHDPMPDRLPGVRQACSCRTSVVTHMANAHGVTRSQALREFGFRGESEPPEIPPEPPPST
ncbi:hypothetical protein C3747_36g222 [Trypanosoma cruzi]|uniref:Uncharacterized protein n=1 Tax=Trypanosoma cruzi TaxID=5693 RepID=A0A2V2X0M1_TRYCR|nr:hypothetical protein C3747_36g222 [Trypanosoma cruzi]